MKSDFLYQQIIDEIQQDILVGKYRPGDRLPTIRETTKRWHCTQGTVDHAYRILAERGLVTIRVGEGTHVAQQVNLDDPSLSAWRLAKIIHQAESFLLEALMAGYSFAEIQTALENARGHLSSMQ